MSRKRDVVWGRTVCEQRSQVVPLVDTTRAYSVEGGRYGYEPAIQGVALGNRNSALRGRGGK